MAAQVNAPTVILTRPAAQGRRFAAELRRRVPGLRIMLAPLMREVLLTPALPGARTVIFTSESGVRAAVRLIAPDQRGAAFCVGPRTAEVARQAGFAAEDCGGDAEALVAALARPGPPLLHLRGEDARGDVAARLTAAGRPTVEAVVYRQDPLSLPARALAALGDTAPSLVPLFSPRAAALFRDAVPRPGSGVTLAAFSPAVAAVVAGLAPMRVAARPEGEAMADLIATWVAELRLTGLFEPPADGRAGPAMESVT